MVQKYLQLGKTNTMKGCLIVETENGMQKNQRMYADMMSMMQGFWNNAFLDEVKRGLNVYPAI